MRIVLLDVGAKMYGDAALIITSDDRRILIDGAHPGDDTAGAAPALQDQIAEALGAPLPIGLDLLVVTHCHSDHIGCIPELYGRRLIRPKHALMADERLGFGRSDQDHADADATTETIIAALREEPEAGTRTNADVAQLLADVAGLEPRYKGLLAALEQDGVDVCRYGRDDHEAFLQRVGIADLQVLGPTQEQLLACAAAIAKQNKDAADAVGRALQADAKLDAVGLYRRLAGSAGAPDAIFADRPGKGAALNDQSILLAIGPAGSRCLVAGDMQFAAAETAGVAGYMNALRRTVSASGPFAFVKAPHHGSYNGMDETVLAEWGTSAIGISTGRGDPGHPNRSVLELLKARTADLSWARTDRNGMIEIDVTAGQVRMRPQRGALNDAALNAREDTLPAPSAPPSPTPGLSASRSPPAPPRAPPPAQAPGSPEVVEVIARIPHTTTRVTITVDVAPGAAAVPASSPSPRSDGWGRLAAGRSLPPLLFVTDLQGLGGNIGREEAQSTVAMIRDAGQELVDLAGASDLASAKTRIDQRAAGKAGVVLIGGYDVVPAFRLDVLPPALRAQVGQTTDDDDNFIVWSDQPYGDLDGDGIGDLPLSRVPDGKSAELVRRALTASASTSPQPSSRAGVRNSARPFADAIYAALPGTQRLNVCAPDLAIHRTSSDYNADLVYFMLHGAWWDAGRFWGEDGRGGLPEGFDTSLVPDSPGAICFSGCCWGALTVAEPANRYRGSLSPRTADGSIALRWLQSGARAFVGCTGVHYSPAPGQTGYFGSPMHEAFWAAVIAGQPPAQALFDARVAYVAGMPHGRPTASEQAIEYKILRQFTCLGLGW